MWTPECQKGFEHLKGSLTSALVLIKPSMTTPFELHTDASMDHVGAVLMQKQDGSLKLVGYFSKKLNL